MQKLSGNRGNNTDWKLFRFQECCLWNQCHTVY